MDIPTNAVSTQITGKSLPVLNMHHELMEHMPFLKPWKPDFRIGYMCAIDSSQPTALLTLTGRETKFICHNGGLDRIHTAVESLINIMIAPVAAIIGQRHDSIGKLLIMRSHSTRIPKSPNIFRRIETESGSIAKTAGGIPAIKASTSRHRSYRLRIIFYDFQPMTARDILNLTPPAHPAIQMNRHYSPCTLRNSIFN